MSKVVFFFSFLFISLYGNTQNASTGLTKEQYCEDYEQFISIVENFDPQLEVRKLVTGEDQLKRLKQMRENAEEVRSQKEFFNLIFFALNVLNDPHAVYYDRKEQFAFSKFDSLTVSEALQAANSWKGKGKRFDISEYFPLHMTYFDGDYITAYNFSIVDPSYPTDTLELPMGTIIKKINGKELDSYFEETPWLYYRWDPVRKKKYTQVLGSMNTLRVDKPVTIQYIDEKNELQEIVYNKDKHWCFLSSSDYQFYHRAMGKVEYFEEGNILYIRMPQMRNSDFYIKQIAEKAKNKDIKKVIWDIRRNGGGNDQVWKETLSMLLDDTLNYKTDFAFLNTELANRSIEDSSSGEVASLPFLKGEYKIVHVEDKVVPADSSLRYKGPIYILQDRYIYSSAGTLSALARQSDRLTTIGIETGYLLGAGITPISFQLKNTKLVFQLEPVIDVTNVKEPYDYYQDKVEIPVNLTKEDWVRYFITDNETLYSKDFLLNEDPIFKKALEQ